MLNRYQGVHSVYVYGPIRKANVCAVFSQQQPLLLYDTRTDRAERGKVCAGSFTTAATAGFRCLKDEVRAELSYSNHYCCMIYARTELKKDKACAENFNINRCRFQKAVTMQYIK